MNWRVLVLDGPALSRRLNGMQSKKVLPVSRDLVRIIRESSRLEGNLTLTDHLSVIDARQAQEVEFYFRACALRLSGGI